MRANPNYRGPNVHSVASIRNPIEYDTPSVFLMPESIGSMPCGGFAAEPPVNSRTRMRAPINTPTAKRARALNRKYYTKPNSGPRLTVNLCPWDQGQLAAMRGDSERANPYNVLDEASEWDEWMDGFRSN